MSAPLKVRIKRYIRVILLPAGLDLASAAVRLPVPRRHDQCIPLAPHA
jgi:hypothetical protein